MKIGYVAIVCILTIVITGALPWLLSDSATVQAQGLTVATVNATGITDSTATLNGNLTDPGSSANITVSFEWGTTTAYGNETTPKAMTATGSFSAALSGLSPDTAYHFRAKAVGNETSYGTNVTFFTSTTGIPVISTNSATSITDTTAILNGNLTDTGASDNITVSFQWGTSAGYGFTTATQLMTATGSFSAPISGLSPATTYHFRSVAYGNGTGYGSDKTFTTKSGPVSLAVTTGDATSVTATGATLNGSLTDLGTSENVTVSFEWGTTSSYGNETTPKTMTATGSFSAALSNLSPGVTYHFRAKVVANTTSYGGDKSLNTAANPPGITTSAATDITTNSAVLNGNLTTLGSATSATTSFEWGTTQGGPYPNQTTPVTMTTTGALSRSLTGLDPDTTYYFRAKAVGDGTSYGSELSFQIKGETAEVPATDDGSFFGDLDWPIIGAVAGGVVLLIVLSIIFSRPKTRPAGGNQQWAAQGGIQQQTPGDQQPYGCPTCGAAIFFGTNPCPNCGTPLNWGSQQMSTCPICGASIPYGANPCPNCGTGLNWHS